MRNRIFLIIVVVPLMLACLEKPVLYRENNIVVSKNNIAAVCTILKNKFADYSCVDFYKKTYKTTKEKEVIKVELLKTQLELYYETARGNEELFDQYKALIEELNPIAN